MSKKPKIDKRLDKLFQGITPEKSNSTLKDKSKGEQKAPPPASANPSSAPGQYSETASLKNETSPTQTRPIKRHASVLLAPEPILTQDNENSTSSYTVNIQTGYQDWSTLRVLDETGQRQWTPDEELLVKQVSDQLSSEPAVQQARSLAYCALQAPA